MFKPLKIAVVVCELCFFYFLLLRYRKTVAPSGSLIRFFALTAISVLFANLIHDFDNKVFASVALCELHTPSHFSFTTPRILKQFSLILHVNERLFLLLAAVMR